MKKKKKKNLKNIVGVVGITTIGATALSGCDFRDVVETIPQPMYGPAPTPIIDNIEKEDVFNPEENIYHTMYGPAIDTVPQSFQSDKS